MESEKLEPEVAAAWFAEHEIELRALLSAVLRNADLVSEALQQTVVRLLESGHTATTETRKGWLFRVAMNEALLLKRQSRRFDEVRSQQEFVSLVRQVLEASPEALASRQEQNERVRRAVNRLPADLQQVVRLRTEEGLSFAEVAERLEIPLGTALSRMRTALSRLSQWLKSDQPSD